MRVVALLVLGCGLSVACARGGGAPLRSPALDYQPPAAGTSDGEIVGADRRGPGDKLHEGVTSDGPAPGWDANKSGLSYDPKQRVGGATEKPATGSSTK